MALYPYWLETRPSSLLDAVVQPNCESTVEQASPQFIEGSHSTKLLSEAVGPKETPSVAASLSTRPSVRSSLLVRNIEAGLAQTLHRMLDRRFGVIVFPEFQSCVVWIVWIEFNKLFD
jgi:hypothetical protein